jgi:hypothetical protein
MISLWEAMLATVVTINRPDVVALIEKAANQITGGNKTELVATAVRCLLEQRSRKKPLFGIRRGSVRIRKGVDLTQPVLDDETDAETGREINR